MKVTQKMVDRFLSWVLPTDFGPDCGISFLPISENHWPIGTNLFSAVQARAMLEHVLNERASEVGINQWKDAVVDACVVNHITWDENDPRKSLHDLISYETTLALDPTVSEPAMRLRESGKRATVWVIERQEGNDHYLGFYGNTGADAAGEFGWVHRVQHAIHFASEHSARMFYLALLSMSQHLAHHRTMANARTGDKRAIAVEVTLP